MLKIKYDFNLMKYMSMFEALTKARVKDCFVDDLKQLVFVVQENEIGKAIGKKGSNVKRLESALKKKIRIIEFNPDLVAFVKNMIYPVQAKGIEEKDSVITIQSPDLRSRGMLIGRGAQYLRNFEKIAKRYFNISEIKIV